MKSVAFCTANFQSRGCVDVFSTLLWQSTPLRTREPWGEHGENIPVVWLTICRWSVSRAIVSGFWALIFAAPGWFLNEHTVVLTSNLILSLEGPGKIIQIDAFDDSPVYLVMSQRVSHRVLTAEDWKRRAAYSDCFALLRAAQVVLSQDPEDQINSLGSRSEFVCWVGSLFNTHFHWVFDPRAV